MPLAPGTHLGPYEITTPLGAGGMGEVYRARDTRLERSVAIKILPEQFSKDPTRKQRFEREAKTISSLNHPHICTLHDIGSQDGIDYLVMECVEGETLAKRLEKGPLPVEQVLKYGAQIADALDKAHRAGIVHRDLKPGNIMLTANGAKLLDFGLAKPSVSASLATMTATKIESQVTQEGTIVGTFQYMSPEQVEGKEVDGRSDIFSLGAVLYEMVTGKRAFEGKSQLSVASAILEKVPVSISSIKPLAPPALDHAIRRCLAKDPEERWQTGRDLALELQWATEVGTQTNSVEFSDRRRLDKWWIGWGLAVLFGVAAASSLLLHWSKHVPAREPVRFTVAPPEHAQFAPGPPWGSPVAVSPNGRGLVFVAVGKDGIRRLWLHSFDTLLPRVLAGTEDASAPFWSPDNEWIGFFADSRLKRVAIIGGEAQTICQCQSGGGGGTWNQNNVILFSPALAGESGLLRVPASGGTPVAVTTLDAAHGETNHVWPLFLPDGRHFLYNRNVDPGDLGIYADDLSAPDHKRSRLLPNLLTTMGYGSGYLLYAEDRVLYAQPLDANRLEATGERIRIVDGVDQVGPGAAAFSVSPNGVLAYWSGASPPQSQLTWVSRNGTRIGPIGPSGPYYHFSLAPDERRVAVTAYDENIKGIRTVIWLLDVLRGTTTKFSFESGAGVPVWSPDGTRIAFSYDNRAGPPTVYVKPVAAPGQTDLIVDVGGNQPTDWSSDGQEIVYEHRNVGTSTRNDVFVTAVSGDRKSRAFLATTANETGGRISPDRRWMAYTSDESGRNEIYVTSFREPDGAIRISTDGGTQPEWRRDGKELFYRTPDRKLIAVSIKVGTTFDAGEPHVLFELPPDPPTWLQGGLDQRVYAPSHDGQRFLIAVPVGETASPPITVVLNWDGELKKK